VDEPCPKSAALESHCEGPTLLIACYYIGKELPYGGQSYRLRRSCPDTDVDNPLCIDLGSGGAGCGTGTCEPGDEPARFSCEGDSMVICSWGLERRFECGDASMGCEMRMLDSELAPLCVPKCERPRCSGTVMSNCFMRPVDCRWFGKDYTCLPTEDGTGVRCGVPERRCNENEAVCDGDAALLCFGGAWLRFDCSQFLNAKCVKVNETRVRCAMPEPPAPTPS
jgi:hypothetical protein